MERSDPLFARLHGRKSRTPRGELVGAALPKRERTKKVRTRPKSVSPQAADRHVGKLLGQRKPKRRPKSGG